MTINKTNVKIINTREMHLHDDTFCGFNYDYANDELTLSLISWGTQKPKTIIFKRVLGFEMTACDFWAPSNRVDCWYAAVNDDDWLLKKFQAERAAHDNYSASKLDDNIEFIETMFGFISGDILEIVCESIDYKET